MDFLLQRKQPTKRLKLFHNEISELGVVWRLLQDSRCGAGVSGGLSDLRLSRLLASLVRRKQEVQPIWPPVWIRMEKKEP